MPLRVERLDNGLRVVMSPDHTSPTVAVAVYYDVGARVEEQGRSGFAHLFEHMMFQGSANVAKGEHFRLVSTQGGSLNGTTSEDRTNYFETLPSNALEVGIFLEADRMRSLAITEEHFENQRQTVMEERRQTYENRPYVLSYLQRDALSYQGYWPYEHSVIGDMSDLRRASLEDVRSFHDRYYAPDNAVISLAGDFEPALDGQRTPLRRGPRVVDVPPQVLGRHGRIRASPRRPPSARAPSTTGWPRCRRFISRTTSPRVARPTTTRSRSSRRCSPTARAPGCTRSS